MPKITIKEIAAEAGVSIGTVDRVLHDRGNVVFEKRELILEICKRHGYEQNIVGRAMAMRRKQSNVAVIINARERNSFAASVYDGINAIAKEIADYNINFSYYDAVENTLSEQLRTLEEIEKQKPDGLIIKPIDNPLVRHHLNRIASKNIPIVFCTSNMDSVDKIAYVGQNHYRDGRLMANMLLMCSNLELHVLMIVGSLQTNARRGRIDGFISYMQEKKNSYNLLDVLEVSYQRDEAHESILAALRKNPDANALYINSPEIEPCLEALKTYQQFKGLRFCFGQREKIGSIITSGEIDFAIREFPFQHGYRAGEVMFKYLLNGEIPDKESCVFQGEIMIEENSAE